MDANAKVQMCVVHWVLYFLKSLQVLYTSDTGTQYIDIYSSLEENVWTRHLIPVTIQYFCSTRHPSMLGGRTHLHMNNTENWTFYPLILNPKVNTPLFAAKVTAVAPLQLYLFTLSLCKKANSLVFHNHTYPIKVCLYNSTTNKQQIKPSKFLTLKVPVTAIDALRYFETG